MLTAAFSVLAVAVALGTTLAVLHLRENATPPGWPLAALHLLAALGGLLLLALALRGPVRGAGQGTESFGLAAAAILAFAAFIGVLLLAARLRAQRASGALIAVHAMIAVTGFVVLFAYYFSG